jgi:type II secretory pathway pseudopilin PulG
VNSSLVGYDGGRNVRYEERRVAAKTGLPPTAQSEGSPKSRRILWWVVGSALAVVAVVGAILYHGYTARPGWVGVTDKKFWDYLDLLIVPVAIAMGVALINWMQSERERRDQAAQQRRELELQDQRAQDDALQAYLDQLTLLLVTKQGQGLVRMKVDDEVRQVVQARSEPLLRSLNPTRRFSLILFLSVMGLLERDRPLVSLAGADLRGIDGRGAPLQGVDLQGADLRDADLRDASLVNADLQRKDELNLNGANLSYTNLSDADLSNANLSGANLKAATGWNEKQLEQARSLEGATMPNGQKYEDWLKDREGRGEDGENRGPS